MEKMFNAIVKKRDVILNKVNNTSLSLKNKFIENIQLLKTKNLYICY